MQFKLVHHASLKKLMTQDQCYQMDSDKNHYLFSATEKITTKHKLYFKFKPLINLYWNILQLSFRSQPYALLAICIQNWRTEHFQHTQAEYLVGMKSSTGSLYGLMHIQPEVFCGAGIPGQLLHHGVVRSQFSL